VLLPPLFVAGVVTVSTAVWLPFSIYWDTSTLAVAAAIAIYNGAIWQALLMKLAAIKRAVTVEDQQKHQTWYLALWPLIVTETVLVSVSLLLVNRIYWALARLGTNTLIAMAASLISVFAAFAFGAVLLVNLGQSFLNRTLTIRKLVIYVAGSGITMALPLCVRYRTRVYGDLIEGRYAVNWFLLCLSLLSLVAITYRLRPREPELKEVIHKSPRDGIEK